ncbi:MAG: HD domain-containing protein [Bryobacteraceae bacterium]|nr:HD domain-containing protein [Bryobacteraceae bacterium]
MKSPMCSDLAPGQSVQGVFLVQSKDIRQKRTGEPYLSLVLTDRTGEIDAKMWDNVADVADTFDRDDFVRVRGETQLYQNRLQLTIYSLQRLPDSEVDLEDFLPVSRRNPEEMWAELRSVIESIGNPDLKELLKAIFDDPEIAEAYRQAPAAKGIHHAWLGGLLEHVLSMCALARFMASHYAGIDLDLLLAGVLLHDIGKIRELDYSRSFSYTVEGGLVGHIQIGLRIVADHLPPGFPPKLRNLLEHMILSHHGQLEFGSPKLPSFPEAMLLHLLDLTDSRMAAMAASIEKEKNSAGVWTGYNAALERNLLDREKYMREPEPPRPAPAVKNAKNTKPSSPFAQALLSALNEGKGK